MNISIIVGGRFHAFNLAEQLSKKNYLKQLITSYPKYYINNRYSIPKNKIESIIFKELVQKSFLNKFFDFNDFLIGYFDKKAKSLEIGVNAGHDLNLQNLKYFAAEVPNLDEVSIGHALISDSLYFGLENTIQMYKRLI